LGQIEFNLNNGFEAIVHYNWISL